jgi:hypothetical protein
VQALGSYRLNDTTVRDARALPDVRRRLVHARVRRLVFGT